MILKDCRIFAAGCDLSGQSNSIDLKSDIESKDATTWRSEGWQEVTGGLAKAAVKAGGFAAFGAAGTQDYDSFHRLGQLDPWTITPEESDVGALAWVTNILRGKYGLGGKVGDLAPWTAEGSSSWPLCRGVILHPPGTARADDGNGTAVQLAATTADQRLYGALHVLSVTGATPTIDVTVQSDSVEAFTGSPETRLTFTQATTVGGEIIRTAKAANADTWYRVAWDCSEVGNESFLFVASIGIW
jgi:hypothetical protein